MAGTISARGGAGRCRAHNVGEMWAAGTILPGERWRRKAHNEVSVGRAQGPPYGWLMDMVQITGGNKGQPILGQCTGCGIDRIEFVDEIHREGIPITA